MPCTRTSPRSQDCAHRLLPNLRRAGLQEAHCYLTATCCYGTAGILRLLMLHVQCCLLPGTWLSHLSELKPPWKRPPHAQLPSPAAWSCAAHVAASFRAASSSSLPQGKNGRRCMQVHWRNLWCAGRHKACNCLSHGQLSQCWAIRVFLERALGVGALVVSTLVKPPQQLPAPLWLPWLLAGWPPNFLQNQAHCRGMVGKWPCQRLRTP